MERICTKWPQLSPTGRGPVVKVHCLLLFVSGGQILLITNNVKTAMDAYL